MNWWITEKYRGVRERYTGGWVREIFFSFVLFLCFCVVFFVCVFFFFFVFFFWGGGISQKKNHFVGIAAGFAYPILLEEGNRSLLPVTDHGSRRSEINTFVNLPATDTVCHCSKWKTRIHFNIRKGEKVLIISPYLIEIVKIRFYKNVVKSRKMYKYLFYCCRIYCRRDRVLHA